MQRRRGVALAAVVAGAALMLGGCMARGVGDGELGLDWAVLPTPVASPASSGVCTTGNAELVDWDMAIFNSEPVACTVSHQSETFDVGTFGSAGATGEPRSRPVLGDPAFREAFEACARSADTFLGGDHHSARVMIRPVMPSVDRWSGGARWYRCEMMEIKSAVGAIVTRTGSLRDGLAGSRPLALTCTNETLAKNKQSVLDLAFVACSTLHDSELTGIYTAPDTTYPGPEQLSKKALDQCYGVGAAYLGLTRPALNQLGGISWIAWGGDEASWAAGDRSFWCFMGEYPARKLTGSIKGRRPSQFPH